MSRVGSVEWSVRWQCSAYRFDRRHPSFMASESLRRWEWRRMRRKIVPPGMHRSFKEL